MLGVRLEDQVILLNEEESAVLDKIEIKDSYIENDKKDNQKADDELVGRLY